MMRRREFITLLGGSAAWPLATRAQQPAKPSSHGEWVAAFVQRLRELHWIEGRTSAIWWHMRPSGASTRMRSDVCAPPVNEFTS
jgi:hypothetical protein